ncbi:MAG: polysaccharide ABC transporter ATP-binding protein [Anaerolineae bacterium]|nr:polysaccharide ABC transporter ATP-binding protein [Anaerolineae bacterium]
MSDVAVRVEGLGKQYRIGGKRERYRTLRDTLADAFTAPFRRAGRLLRGQAYGAAGLEETIWALKDVSFEVKHGEVVGIIGRNGAGKSTLLKVLSRITEPTEGYADVYGRVGSLLEVGTGFHPELTGRENIYLNGAILGMTRAEIDRKFDEIVDFAEIERFMDTPVKHYSSGMGLRLGFAVAAHLEPEILVVDEVLAVGDAAFQKKCLGKMGEVAGEGRTVLLVSHNMAAIQALCHQSIWIEGGRVNQNGGTQKVIESYLDSAYAWTTNTSGILPIFSQTHGIGITGCSVHLDPSNDGYTTLRIEIEIETTRILKRIGLGITLTTTEGTLVSMVDPYVTEDIIDRVDHRCRCTFICDEIDRYLAGGDYVLSIWVEKPRVEYLIRAEKVTKITIPARDLFGTGRHFQLQRNGFVPLPMRLAIEAE